MGNLGELFTSFNGRIGRQRFWIGAVILIVVSIIVSLILSPIFGVSMFNMGQAMTADGTIDPQVLADEAMAMGARAGWANLVTFLILLYPISAVSIKRRHDRGSNGMDYWIYVGLTIITMLSQATGIGYTTMDMGGFVVPTPSAITWVLLVITGLLGLYLLVVMGFLKGTSGENSYGPDPLA